jgi:hypothetical protein
VTAYDAAAILADIATIRRAPPNCEKYIDAHDRLLSLAERVAKAPTTEVFAFDSGLYFPRDRNLGKDNLGKTVALVILEQQP